MCHARGVTSEPALPADSGAVPDMAAPAKVVAGQRAETDRLQDLVATSAVLERAKGALMTLTGCSPNAAYEELLRRARAGARTLLEECWITLGSLTPPFLGGAASETPVDEAEEAPPRPPAALDRADAAVLARLGLALVHVATPQDLARQLLEHLRPAVAADAVLIYRRPPSGGLELTGYAGVEDTLADQWRRIPPVSGIVALDVLATREPRWLEDAGQDRKRYLLIGDPPDRWRARAWLPVVTGDVADVAIGVLRRRSGPFTPRARELLLAATRLCAGRISAFGTRPRLPAGGTGTVVQSLFDALPGTTLLLSPLRAPTGEVVDYRIDAATPHAVDVVGRAGRELLGLRVLECWPAIAGSPLWQGWLTVLDTGKPYEGEPFARQDAAAGGRELAAYSVRAVRLEGGDALVVTWVRHDSSDRREQRLADLQRLGNVGWATWNLATREITWSSQVYTLFDRDPAQGPAALEELAGLALPEDAPQLSAAVHRLLTEGRPFDVPFRIRARTAGGVRHLRAVAEVVPDDRGTPLEVHGIVQDLTAQRSAELALVESERAILAQHGVLQAERTLAGRLQHALLPLPRHPVDLAGLRVEVAYLPAQSGIHVGGDWFSAIPLPDGDALFVVGDVTGHGLDAVATMAQLRFTAKGMIITGSSLTDALSRLNTLLLHTRDSHANATMVLARYHPDERRLRWAQAGHLPPLLLRDGRARYLDRPRGVLLGATPSPVFEEAQVRLRAGDRLLLYTDGLVERPGEGLDAGLDRLAGAAAGPGDGQHSLSPLLAAMLEGEWRDDVCVVDIRVPDTG
ncbi:transcription antitermination regulator [Streptomyces echinoruber]|uniref:Transcription antitermination regulator n=2 Tax=Streptomyces echinoruber TaxID=68898 RepID=A0A918R5X4_9ACTN|nr:transcription antitermination regulator [Streptomyces echinoruber]